VDHIAAQYEITRKPTARRADTVKILAQLILTNRNGCEIADKLARECGLDVRLKRGRPRKKY